MNKARILKMYMNGESIYEIAKECGCAPKVVYSITAAHGVHRKRGRKQKPAPEPKPKQKHVPLEPMYREIPTHLPAVNIDEEHKKQVADLKEYRRTHEQPWYLKW